MRNRQTPAPRPAVGDWRGLSLCDRQVARGLGVDLSRQEAAGAQGRDRVGAFASMGRSRKGGARARLRPAPPLRRSCGMCLCLAPARGFACVCAEEAGTKPGGENGTGSCRRKCDGSREGQHSPENVSSAKRGAGGGNRSRKQRHRRRHMPSGTPTLRRAVSTPLSGRGRSALRWRGSPDPPPSAGRARAAGQGLGGTARLQWREG